MFNSIRLSSALNAALVWAVLFPFVPGLVRSSDTQPTFFLVFLVVLLVAFALPSVGRETFHISYWGVTLCAAMLLVLSFLLLFSNGFGTRASIPSRVFSFVQFCAASLWAVSGKYQWTRKPLFKAMFVYVVFTAIYFATHGLVENILIHSRQAASASLFESGRGARTLSPEPSFFAMQVFNIYILARLIGPSKDDPQSPNDRFLLMIAFCLLASFSVYGALVLLIILADEYPRTVVIATAVVIFATGLAYGVLQHWQSLRAVAFVVALVESHGSIAKIFLLDASLASRIDSLLAYTHSFAESPFIGNGFSLLQGGGFASIVAAFGLAGLIFFVWLFSRILRLHFPTSTKALLLVWFALNFVSGPIGVPIIGLIVGTIMSRHSLRASSGIRPPQAALQAAT